MGYRTLGGHPHPQLRRRGPVSLSSPTTSSAPVEQLDRAVEIIYQITRALPEAELGREELIAIGGLLTQISGALLTFTERLNAQVQHYDRSRAHDGNAGITAPPQQDATGLLRDCHSSYLAARTSARAFHAELRR